MTLVARLAVNSFPLLVADLLLSGDEVPGESLTVPSIGDTTSAFPAGSLTVPTGTIQKIVIAGNNLVLGWAGGRSAAGSVIRDLIEENKAHPFTLGSLYEYFGSLHKSVWEQKCGFVGFIKEGLTLSYFGFNSRELQTESFGVAGLLGSGSEHAVEFLQSVSNLHATRDINDVERASAYGLFLAGSFLSIEMTTHESLYNYFGAGYEVVSLTDGKFEKLNDVTYLFWQGEITNTGLAANLRQICKYSYTNDVLLIRPATLRPQTNSFTISQSVHVIRPVYRDVTDEDLKAIHIPTFDSKWLCNYILIPDPGREAIFSHIHYRGDEESPITFVEEKGGLTIGFKKEFMETMLKDAIKTF